MTNEQTVAIQNLIKGCALGQSKGAFNLQQARDICDSILFLENSIKELTPETTTETTEPINE